MMGPNTDSRKGVRRRGKGAQIGQLWNDAAAIVHAFGDVEAFQHPLVDAIDQQMAQVGIHLDALENAHAVAVIVALQVQSGGVGAVFGEDEAIKGMMLAVGLNQVDIAFDRGDAVIGGRGVHVHVENHGPGFPLPEGRRRCCA